MNGDTQTKCLLTGRDRRCMWGKVTCHFMAKDKNVSTCIKNEVAVQCASIDILGLV